jgi:hypothetical protein
MRPSGTIRGKWRLLDGKAGERSVVMFGAPKVVVLHLSGPGEQFQLCTNTYGIYGVPQT